MGRPRRPASAEGAASDTKQRAPRKSLAVRVAEKTRATLERRIRSIDTALSSLRTKRERALAKLDERYGSKIEKLEAEVGRTKTLLRQVDGFLNPSAPPPGSGERSAGAASARRADAR